MTEYTLTPVQPKPQYTLVPVEQPEAPLLEYADPWSAYENGPTVEDIKADPKLRKIVIDSMNARYTGDAGRLQSAADYNIFGGNYDPEADFDKTFEVWQNYNRSFAGGQTVTTAAEVAFLQKATPEQKAAVGMGYALFDSMPNIFTGDGAWGDTFDGMRDYAAAAIIDPTTVLGLGVGKAISTIGGKGAAVAVRTVAIGAAKEAIKKGATREAARLAAQKVATLAVAKGALKATAKTAAVDFIASVGADLGYQWAQIDVGNQEEYSPAQTAIAALGTFVAPALIGITHGVKALRGTKMAKTLQLDNYVKVTEALKDQINADPIKLISKEVNTESINAKLSELLGDFLKDPMKYQKWLQGVEEGALIASKKDLSVGDMENLFFRSLLFGAPDGSTKGLANILDESGFVWIPRNADDNVGNFIGDFISSLSDDYLQDVTKAMKSAGEDTFKSFGGDTFKDLTAKELGVYFKKRTSNVGKTLADLATFKRTLTKSTASTAGGSGAETTVEEMLQALATPVHGLNDKVRWVQANWKKAVTAHPGTTGLNVKGWGMTYALNNISDVVEGVLHGTVGLVTGSAASKNAAKGSLIGAMRRGASVLTYLDTSAAVDDFLKLKPKLSERLFTHVTGGVDQSVDIAKVYGVNPKSSVVKAVEGVTDFAQKISAVKLQDEITKKLSFMSALDQEIMKATGKSFNEFMDQPGAYTKMFSKEFKEIEEKALERALRETYSQSFTRMKVAPGLIHDSAKFIEEISRTPGIGMLLPFGQFLNNSIATLGDYSGANFVRYLSSKSFRGETSGTQLLAKGLVGWAALYSYFVPKAEENIDKGLRWNQVERSDGSIADTTYDAPLPFAQVIAHLIAYQKKYGEVPTDMVAEAKDILVGQAFRQMGDAQKEFNQFFSDMLQGSLTSKEMFDFLVASSVSTVASGATRFLDPVNQLTMLVTNTYENPDRRQGAKALNESLRYVDGMFTATKDGLPERSYPTRLNATQQDIGKVLGGVRSVQPPSLVEKMLASAGISPWKAIKWDGNYPQLKNELDTLIQPILAAYAESAMDKHPDFFKLSLSQQQGILKLEVTDPAKQVAKDMLKSGVSDKDEYLSRLMALTAASKTDIERAKRFFGITGELEDIGAEEGGLDKLDLILDYVKNKRAYEDY